MRNFINKPNLGLLIKRQGKQKFSYVFITNKIAEAGNILDIKVLDHLIIGNDKYISLKEQGFFWLREIERGK